MAEVRVQVAYHFTFDPAKQLGEIPTEITRTVVVGDYLAPKKVDGIIIEDEVFAEIEKEMEKLVFKALKTAKPAPKPKPEASVPAEQGAQGSLL